MIVFAKITCHLVECRLICSISIVELFFTLWCWLQIPSFTWSRYRTPGGSDPPKGDTSIAPTAVLRGPCLHFPYFLNFFYSIHEIEYCYLFLLIEKDQWNFWHTYNCGTFIPGGSDVARHLKFVKFQNCPWNVLLFSVESMLHKCVHCMSISMTLCDYL